MLFYYIKQDDIINFFPLPWHDLPKFCLKMGMAPSEKLNTPIKQQSVHHPLLIWKLQNIENHE